MPRVERPGPSPLADFGENETAATWGQNEDVEDMPKEDRLYEGIHPPAPQRPNFEGKVMEGSNSRHIPLIGMGAIEGAARSDPYYDAKVKQGLIQKPEK